MEQFILILLLAWLIICTLLTITVSFTQRRHAMRSQATALHFRSGDTAPVVVRARTGRQTMGNRA